MDFSPEQLAALDAESKGPTTLVVVILFTILSFFFVCMRYVSRFAIIKRGSAEDYTIGVAMVRGLCVESELCADSIQDTFNWNGSLHD
jgi:hypothetical protein